MCKPKSIVLISGYGSNLKKIIEETNADFINMNIELVISNNKKAHGLTIAKEAGLKIMVINEIKDSISKISEYIKENSINLIILAGFMKILPKEFVDAHSGKILNIHPSLLPKYKGLNTHKNVLNSEDVYHGASVHFVTSDLDSGPVIIQGRTLIKTEDNVESLKQRVHKIEHQIYPLAIKWFVDKHITQDGSRCLFDGEILECPIENLTN